MVDRSDRRAAGGRVNPNHGARPSPDGKPSPGGDSRAGIRDFKTPTSNARPAGRPGQFLRSENICQRGPPPIPDPARGSSDPRLSETRGGTL